MDLRDNWSFRVNILQYFIISDRLITKLTGIIFLCCTLLFKLRLIVILYEFVNYNCII